ncbi:xylosidase/arabinosidase [Asticcacaulis biprosthecium C19]|uniref:Xylosidase/arabinosidase n=1 Tax=Asticcacaulis biprosthecium C19 TaxID=715226 RepID=F4QH79_9CAUL|nr:family 43 glycosylhydrolase [Asticcacaulis biprosthecium]EGF92616.1 xylosidase/arabinosidase [Asticcacaulis biprosthecium C19]
MTKKLDRRAVLSASAALAVLASDAGRVLAHPAGDAASSNPIFRDVFTADPAALVYQDRLYVYAGHDNAKEGQFFTMPGWRLYSSDDAKAWTSHGYVLRPEAFSYGRADVAWAAQVVEKDGKFYFYTTLRLRESEHHAIAVAVGDRPEGPFTDARGTPLITDGMTTDSKRTNADIDPTVFIDVDGTAWMAWGNGDCYLVKLKPNMIELDGPIHRLDLVNYAEGPWLFRRGDLYYNVYAGEFNGSAPEHIGYSTAPSMLGP